MLKAESAQAILNLETVADGISLPCRLALSWLVAPVTGRRRGRRDAFAQRRYRSLSFPLCTGPRDKLAVLVMSNADTAEPLVASVSTLAMTLMRQAKYGDDVR